MNSSLFLKSMRRTRRFFINQQTTTRLCQQMSSNKMSTNALSQSKEMDTFQDVLPCVLNSLSTNPKLQELPEVTSWISKILDYNLTGGKKARGLTTVIAYEMLEKPENITKESMKLARIMGWCVEMLQAYFLMADDMMDQSTTRRGMPCWYRMPDVGLSCINDCILLYSSMFYILKTYFGNMPQYSNILDLFNETFLLTSAGQHLDFVMAHRNKNDYSLFTIDKYYAIVKYKTALYSYKLPVGLGLLLTNVTDSEIHKKIDDICVDIGTLFQMQDDYIDCFGDESVTGKAGTDIQEGKCSWLAVVALQHCNEAQRKVFEANYSRKEPAHVERIKQLYNELELPRIYREWERSRYDMAVSKAHALSQDTSLSPKLFLRLIDMIYNRKH